MAIAVQATGDAYRWISVEGIVVERETGEGAEYHIDALARAYDGEPWTPVAGQQRVRWHIEWEPSNADAFLAPPGPFIELVSGAIAHVTGHAGADHEHIDFLGAGGDGGHWRSFTRCRHGSGR